MTPNYIAKIIEKNFQNMNTSTIELLNSNEWINFNRGLYLLEKCLKINIINILEGKVEMSDLCFKWSPKLCMNFINFYIWYRANNFTISPYIALTKYLEKNYFIPEITFLLRKKINKAKIEYTL
jgi:hypothetical protein